MFRHLDRIIGAVVTIMAGTTILAVRATIRRYRTRKRHRRAIRGSEKADYWYRIKYEETPLRQYEGSCHCQAISFFVQATEEIHAIDCSDQVSSKKGRYPQLIVPISCFRLVSDMENLALYSSESIGHRHLFCKVCGIHIFNVDSQFPELVGVNVHCLDHPNLNVRVSFVPTSISSAFEMVAKERTTDTTSEYSCRTDDYRQASGFQDVLLAYAQLNTKPQSSGFQTPVRSPCSRPPPLVPSPASSYRSYQTFDEPPSRSRHERTDVLSLKSQLERYLKHHVDHHD